MNRHITEACLAAAFLAWGQATFGQSTSMSLTPAADTTLFESNPDNNLGGAPTLVAGSTAAGERSRALLKFDVAGQLPAGAKITSAMLKLRVSRAPNGGGASSMFELKRVLTGWGEGVQSSQTGAAAAPGEATWKARFAPATLWSLPGGAEDVDFGATTSAATAVGGLGDYGFASTPELVADAQFWLEHPEANFGWLLRSQNESTAATARRFASREDASAPPTLLLEYTSAALPRMAGITVSGTNVVIRWADAKPPCQLQRKISLLETNWTNIGAPLQTNTTVVPIDADASMFRVLASP